MRNSVIWCIVLLAMAGTAFSETKEPPKELTVDLDMCVKLEMVLIPAGEFMMGSPVNNENYQKHHIRIGKAFNLGKYPVTQEQWNAVMDDNPSQFRGAKRPVECVSWDDCRVFLGKLNVVTKGQVGKFVLPTEAQWEYACRAGSKTTFCFGDKSSMLDEYAWYTENSADKTHPVGEKKPNAWGFYDMHGNVSEWCEDWFDLYYYENSPKNDPRGPESGSFRVGRGGGWGSRAISCGCAVRGCEKPGERAPYLGLRVALNPAEIPGRVER